MKYIRTKDENNLIIDMTKMILPYNIVGEYIDFNKFGMFKIIKQADTIEELCDVLILKTKNYRGFKGGLKLADIRQASGTKEDLHNYLINQMSAEDLFDFAFLGIETDKGLIYVAKMNSKGELELL